jgi:hypothetical protein
VIDLDYFGFRHIPHPDGCKRPGWEVLERHERDRDGRERELIIRIVCPQPKGCGVYHEWKVSLCHESDPETGDPHSGIGTASGPVEAIGYGTAPITVAEVWLHASRPLLHGDPPDHYLVTATKERPRNWQDLLGALSQARSSRSASGFSKRWVAASGYQEGKYGGDYATPARSNDQLTSRTAAVRWVVEQAAAEPGPAEPEPSARLVPSGGER